MRKRYLAVLVAGVCVCLLIGCREQKNDPSTNPNATNTQTIASTEAGTLVTTTVPTVSVETEEIPGAIEETRTTVENETTDATITEPLTQETTAPAESGSEVEKPQQTETTEKTEPTETEGSVNNIYTLPSFDD